MRGGNVEREFSLSVILQLVPVGQNLLFSLGYIILFATKVSTLYSQTSTNAHPPQWPLFWQTVHTLTRACQGKIRQVTCPWNSDIWWMKWEQTTQRWVETAKVIETETIAKTNSEMLTMTWPPPQKAKQPVLKFRLVTYMLPLRGPHKLLIKLLSSVPKLVQLVEMYCK